MTIPRQNRSSRFVIRLLLVCCAQLAIALAGAWIVNAVMTHAVPVVTLQPQAAAEDAGFVALPDFAKARAHTGVAIHEIDDERLLDAVKDVGFSFVRTDLFWEAVQAPDGWHFESFDKLVSNLAARRLGALLILGYKHYQFSPEQPPTTDAQLAAFSTYVYRSVQRYRAATVRFEVWNEEDDKVYWLAEPSPPNYRRLLVAAVKAARAADPQVQIASGGVQQFDLPFIGAVGDISSATLRGPDAISVHPYRQSYPESVFGDYRKLRELLATYRNAPAVWSTEWSYPSYGYEYVAQIGDGHSSQALARQANYTVRRFLVDWIAAVGLSVYYDMRDDGTDAKEMEHNFGLLDAHNNKLPAYEASKHLFSLTADTTSAKYVIDEKEQYVVLKLKSGTDALRYVIWSYGEGNAVKVDVSHLPERSTFTNMYGRPLTTAADLIEIPESLGPIFVTVGSGSARAATVRQKERKSGTQRVLHVITRYFNGLFQPLL